MLEAEFWVAVAFVIFLGVLGYFGVHKTLVKGIDDRRDRIRAELDERPFNPFDKWGEDFAFFERLRKLNIPAWCCPDIRSFHLRVQETTMDDFDPKMVQVLKDVQTPGSPMRVMQPEA